MGIAWGVVWACKVINYVNSQEQNFGFVWDSYILSAKKFQRLTTSISTRLWRRRSLVGGHRVFRCVLKWGRIFWRACACLSSDVRQRTSTWYGSRRCFVDFRQKLKLYRLLRYMMGMDDVEVARALLSGGANPAEQLNLEAAAQCIQHYARRWLRSIAAEIQHEIVVSPEPLSNSLPQTPSSEPSNPKAQSPYPRL